jgi:hypothetical protein
MKARKSFDQVLLRHRLDENIHIQPRIKETVRESSFIFLAGGGRRIQMSEPPWLKSIYAVADAIA